MRLILGSTMFCLCLGVGQASSDAVLGNANVSLLCTADQEITELQEGVTEVRNILGDSNASHQNLVSEQIKTLDKRLSVLEEKVAENASTLHQFLMLFMNGGAFRS